MDSLFASPTGAWTKVSPSLAIAHILDIAAGAILLAAIGAVCARWFHITGLLVIGTAVVVFFWGLWWAPRNQRRWGYAESDDALYITSGRFLRRTVVVPYGRIQYVDVSVGPIGNHFGIGRVDVHTASARTWASISGVPIDEAQSLRDRLTARADAWSAGV